LARRLFSKIASLDISSAPPLICSTILAKDKNEFLETAKKAERLGCDVVELRVDHLQSKDSSQIKSIIEETPLPLIATLRSVRDGGLFPAIAEPHRISMMNAVIDFSPAFIDVELEVNRATRRKLIEKAKKREVRMICSHHDFGGVPSIARLLEFATRAQASNADLTKLVFTPKELAGVFRILQLANSLDPRNKPFTAFGMGRAGWTTRLTSLLLGSCMVYCSLGRTDEKLGQVTVGYAKKYFREVERYGWSEIRKYRNQVLRLVRAEMGQAKDNEIDPFSVIEKIGRVQNLT
jgi:3-dehydroquinate dehydratase I